MDGWMDGKVTFHFISFTAMCITLPGILYTLLYILSIYSVHKFHRAELDPHNTTASMT